MKVRELIERLKQQPQDLPVIVDGYESGYEDVETVVMRSIAFNVRPAGGVYGPHDDSPSGDPQNRAIVIATRDLRP